MKPLRIDQSLIPGTSKLFADFLYHPERVAEFYSSEANGGPIDYPDDRRARMAAVLRTQNGDCDGVMRFAQAGTLAVLTGQQVGLLGGPIYTIYKALTAVRLARQLSKSGTSAVPIFWMAAEDHDLVEVDHAWVFNHDAKPCRVSVGHDALPGSPAGLARITEFDLPALRAALGDLPFTDEAMQLVANAYHPGATMGSAFVDLLRPLLAPLGVLFLDTLLPEVRDMAVPFFGRMIDELPHLIPSLGMRGSALEKAGYHTQVRIGQGASLLFLFVENRRRPLRFEEGRFSMGDRTFSPAELRLLAHQLSPNALLRPVLQDYLLPTAAFVAGPAEIAYMAQAGVLYDRLLGRAPTLQPRVSLTLLDARAGDLLDRYSLKVPDLLQYREKAMASMAGGLIPAAVRQRIAAAGARMEAEMSALRQDLSGIDPMLDWPARKATSKTAYQLEKLSHAAAREALRRDAQAMRDFDYLSNLIHPRGHLQERVYSLVPFLARHGMDLPERLLANLPVGPDHAVIRL